MRRIVSLILICLMIFSLSACDGYLFIGDGWQDTPEKALKIAADARMDGESLTPSLLLDTWYVEDKAFMLFVSEAGWLAEAEFVTNEKGQYHFYGFSEGTPGFFIICEENEFASYSRYGSYVWGYTYSSERITVNGVDPEIKSYIFTCEGKEWTINRFWIDGIDETAEIIIEYVIK